MNPWKNINPFLEKFRNIKPPKRVAKETISGVIKSIIGVSIAEEDIEIKGSALYIKSSDNLIKNQVFLHKEKILEALGKRTGSKIREIKFY